MYNIASKAVAIVSVEDVKENVNLYLEFGILFQSIKFTTAKQVQSLTAVYQKAQSLFLAIYHLKTVATAFTVL